MLSVAAAGVGESERRSVCSGEEAWRWSWAMGMY
jgi:hypothetical protein